MIRFFLWVLKRQACTFIRCSSSLSLHYGLSCQNGPEADRHIFRRRDGAPSVGGKWADCIANFPATINLQYEIAGAELSRPKAAHYCFILLVSYYQQSQSTPTAPHTQSRFYITSIRRCTNAENIWRQPWELCFLRGWEGLFERREPSAGPLCVCSLGWAAVTPWGPLVFFSVTFPPPSMNPNLKCLHMSSRSFRQLHLGVNGAVGCMLLVHVGCR